MLFILASSWIASNHRLTFKFKLKRCLLQKQINQALNLPKFEVLTLRFRPVSIVSFILNDPFFSGQSVFCFSKIPANCWPFIVPLSFIALSLIRTVIASNRAELRPWFGRIQFKYSLCLLVWSPSWSGYAFFHTKRGYLNSSSFWGRFHILFLR